MDFLKLMLGWEGVLGCLCLRGPFSPLSSSAWLLPFPVFLFRAPLPSFPSPAHRKEAQSFLLASDMCSRSPRGPREGASLCCPGWKHAHKHTLYQLYSLPWLTSLLLFGASWNFLPDKLLTPKLCLGICFWGNLSVSLLIFTPRLLFHIFLLFISRISRWLFHAGMSVYLEFQHTLKPVHNFTLHFKQIL